MMMKSLGVFLFVTAAFIGCEGDPIKNSNTPDTVQVSQPIILPNHTFRYNLNQPDQTLKLDKDLEEISGLGIDPSGDYLYAVQDEDGDIFMLDIKTGKIKAKTKFHKSGDYEGIEVVDNSIFVVKSTGTLYKVSNVGGPDQQLKKFNSFLSRENDVEGLAFDPNTNCLLLACKGLPATGESFASARYKKSIYQFDLATNVFLPKPVYTLELNNIRKYLNQHKSLREYEKLVEFFSAGKENLTFNPSSIAVHPITSEIYLTSSSGKVLLVLSRKGEIIHIEKLDKDVHAQPEGMAFATDGTLYISNEGKGGRGLIHQFNYQQ